MLGLTYALMKAVMACKAKVNISHEREPQISSFSAACYSAFPHFS